jgi:hypothetical protein
MMDLEALMDEVLTGKGREQRRQAFLALVASDAWPQVLAPHVISRLGYEVNGELFPDRTTFDGAAPLIAKDEDKIYRSLEILGARFTDELLLAVAREMGPELVEHALVNLRTAEGERALMLERVLYEADSGWVKERAARRVIRTRLKTEEPTRMQLMAWLGSAGNLGDFVDAIREFPPLYLEEWSALGRCQITEEQFVNRALALLGQGPEPLAYLLRLDPIPPEVILRVMAAAKPDWLINGLEVAIIEGLTSRELIPLTELAVRLGGRHLAVAVAWLNSAHLGPQLLGILVEQIKQEGGRERLSNTLWVQRRAPSANHALEQGRKGQPLDPMDAAALVRQLQGPRMLELVQEILEQPWPEMMDSVLRPLCAINPEAAEAVLNLSKNPHPDLSSRALQALKWPDVIWPEKDEEDLPATYAPLGEGI